ncbi:kelch repeat-containing protein [Archangium lansingense]|uniref:kelch repeat-containing protein n=1 Tax=Archangium lansingense TaxID=2995310 RepID=UPI003B7E46CE
MAEKQFSASEYTGVFRARFNTMMLPKRFTPPTLHIPTRWPTLARCVTLMGALAGYSQAAVASTSGSSCTSPDLEPPVLTCPAAITVQCVYSGQDVLFDHADPEFSDNCGLQWVNYQPEYIGSPSTFTSWISATDLSGNSTSCATVWTVVDTHAPNLDVYGPLQMSLPVGAIFEEPGYRLVDDSCDGSYWWEDRAQRSGSVNTGVPGTYTLTYRGSDRSGNESTATRQVKVYPFQPTLSSVSNTPQPRLLHTATLLQNGRVLVTGGFNTAAEEYDAQQAAWTTAGNSFTTHRGHTATVLHNGKVLIAGGTAPASEELYDPALKLWSLASPMSTPRYNHAAVTLPEGRVLVAGGGSSESSSPVLASAELYDPATNQWSPAGSLQTARRGHTMTLMKNGRVLVTGGTDENGNSLSSVELYDPATRMWSAMPGMSTGRTLHSATLLENGKLLVVGGSTQAWNQGSSTELFDFATYTWTVQGSLNNPRQEHTATRVIGDLVVVTGGFSNQSGILSSSEVYSPNTGTWKSTTSLGVGRYKHTATSLDAYTVLLVGGANNTNQSAVELFKVNAQ